MDSDSDIHWADILLRIEKIIESNFHYQIFNEAIRNEQLTVFYDDEHEVRDRVIRSSISYLNILLSNDFCKRHMTELPMNRKSFWNHRSVSVIGFWHGNRHPHENLGRERLDPRDSLEFERGTRILWSISVFLVESLFHLVILRILQEMKINIDLTTDINFHIQSKKNYPTFRIAHHLWISVFGDISKLTSPRFIWSKVAWITSKNIHYDIVMLPLTSLTILTKTFFKIRSTIIITFYFLNIFSRSSLTLVSRREVSKWSYKIRILSPEGL